MGATPMLRRLRVKFIVLNMTLAALVLGAAFAVICAADYQADRNEVHQALIQAVTRTGKGPRLTPDLEQLIQGDRSADEERVPSGGQGSDAASALASAPTIGEGSIGAMGENEGDAGNGADGSGADGSGAPGNDSPDWMPPQIGGEGLGDNAVPVAVYYVTGTSIVQMPDRSSATVPEDLLIAAVPSVMSHDAEWGFLPEQSLYFVKRNTGPNALIAFADGSAADGWRSLALALTVAWAGAMAVLFLLNLLFSRWALRPVQQAWNRQQQFVADASHELKTPLTVILANNAILRQRSNETIASQAQWIESTQMEAERMQGLVTDMLDLARSDAAAAKATTRERVDFSRLVEGEVLTFESVAFEKGLTWESAVAPGVAVAGDGRRLQRLVAVLLDNACKYTDPGGRIDVTLAADERAAELAVRNTGEPIAPDDLAHLFDRFYRADKARTHLALSSDDDSPTPGGYGLGLAIAQDIAQAHKGTLRVTSTAAEGTTFTLRLPLV